MTKVSKNSDLIHDVQRTSNEAAALLADLEGNERIESSTPSSLKSIDINQPPKHLRQNDLSANDGSSQGTTSVQIGIIIAVFIVSGVIVFVSVFSAISTKDKGNPNVSKSISSLDSSVSDSIPYGKASYKSGRTSKTELIGVKLSRRTNSNAYIAYDAIWADGSKSSYIFWRSGRADIYSKNRAGDIKQTRAHFRQTSNGDCVITAETNAVTTFPNFSPSFN